MVVKIRDRHLYLWRAVDDEGEVLDMMVQHRRDTEAALALLKLLLWNQRITPQVIVTDGLKSYVSALDELGLLERHRPGRLRMAGNFGLTEPAVRMQYPNPLRPNFPVLFAGTA